MPVNRKNVNRVAKNAMRGESASKTIGEIYSGCDIFGTTKGQFSLIDIINHCFKDVKNSDIII